MRAYAQADREVTKFRVLADEVRFLAVGTDPLSEKAPYYDTRRGTQTAEQALRLAEQWGADLEYLSLAPDKASQKQELRHEIYGLLLLLVQSRLQLSHEEDDASRALALLDRAEQLREPTRNFFRLRSECNRLLSRREPAAGDQQRVQDPRMVDTALDHFLEGELYRRMTWNEDQSLSEDGHRPAYQQHLNMAVEEFQTAVELQPDHYWAHLQLGRCYMGLGRPAEAVGALSACVALRPQASWAYAVRGLAYALMKDYRRALRDLDRLVAESPEF